MRRTATSKSYRYWYSPSGWWIANSRFPITSAVIASAYLNLLHYRTYCCLYTIVHRDNYLVILSGSMMRGNAARSRGVMATAVVAVLVAMELILYVAANMAETEIDNNGEATNTDEATTTQNIIKILYCTSWGMQRNFVEVRSYDGCIRRKRMFSYVFKHSFYVRLFLVRWQSSSRKISRMS